MLVARRDPPFHTGTHDVPHAHGYQPRHSSRLMSALQIVGTLVGIPVGLASVYSIYQSNFTVEARCATLRGNIVSMLDKSADASTLRMLVRRDVVTFETDCGTVDPDAVKAFRALLTAKAAPPAASAEPAKQVVHEPVQKPVETVKQAAPQPKPAPVVVEAKPAAREAATSDAKWIDSVREALTHAPAHEEATEAPVVTPPPAAQAQPSQLPPRVVIETPPAPASPPMQLAPLAAPVLPPPVSVVSPPSPPPADHPVPPGSVPDAPPAAMPAEPTPGHSWLAKIPLVNRVVGD
jgi:hypothetical protein